MHSWDTFGARINYGHTWTHKTHHNPDLGGNCHLPFILLSMINHEGHIQMSFYLGTPKLGISKFPKLRFVAFWKAITSCVNLWLKWILKQNCSPHQELSNDMCQATCTHLFQGDSQLVVVGNQIGILTLKFSFGHN